MIFKDMIVYYISFSLSFNLNKKTIEMQKILVPTDFSDISENAAKLAADLASKFNAQLHLVNFTPHPFGSTFSVTGEVGGNEEIDFFTIELLKKNRQRIMALAEKYGQNCEAHYHIYDEEFEDGFEPYIRDQDIDLVVMGTSGESTATEFFTGNHTEQMIQRASCPVISLKGNYDSSDFTNIVLGIDLQHDKEDNYSRAAKIINKFASGLGAKIHAVHVADLNADNDAIRPKVQAFVDKYQFGDCTIDITQNNDKEDGLLSYSYANSADILVTMTHEDGGFFSFFTKSTAEDLSKSSPIPVMAINLHNI